MEGQTLIIVHAINAILHLALPKTMHLDIVKSTINVRRGIVNSLLDQGDAASLDFSHGADSALIQFVVYFLEHRERPPHAPT